MRKGFPERACRAHPGCCHQHRWEATALSQASVPVTTEGTGQGVDSG